MECLMSKAARTILGFVVLAGTLISEMPSGSRNTAHAGEFLGVEIDEKSRTYVVTRDVNVRAKPDTKSKRVAGLKKGQRVSVVGRHQGWLAIMQDGKPFGFAYFKYLVPLIDGAFEETVRGKASVNGDGQCEYEITYVGRSSTDTTEFGMADYDTVVRCDRIGAQFTFNLFMFMTEGAYKPSRPNVHQIGIDLWEIDTVSEYDEIFSTNVFFNSEKSKVVFDAVTLEPYAGKPETEEREAETVPDALRIAVGMALESWNTKAWDDLVASLKGDNS